MLQNYFFVPDVIPFSSLNEIPPQLLPIYEMKTEDAFWEHT